MRDPHAWLARLPSRYGSKGDSVGNGETANEPPRKRSEGDAAPGYTHRGSHRDTVESR